MNTITLPRETVEQALKEFKEIIDWHLVEKVPLREQELRSINSRIEELSAALKQAEPQAQAGGPRLFCKVEDVFDNDSILAQLGVKRGDILITLQSHREAMAAFKSMSATMACVEIPSVMEYCRELEQRLDKKDAALKACVEAMDECTEDCYGNKFYDAGLIAAAITRAKEQP